MGTPFDPRHIAAPLVRAAERAGFQFEASQNGAWIRLAGPQGIVYLVQDTWGDGCTMMQLGTSDGRHTRHFLDPARAVVVAAERAGVPLAEGLMEERPRVRVG